MTQALEDKQLFIVYAPSDIAIISYSLHIAPFKLQNELHSLYEYFLILINHCTELIWALPARRNILIFTGLWIYCTRPLYSTSLAFYFAWLMINVIISLKIACVNAEHWVEKSFGHFFKFIVYMAVMLAPLRFSILKYSSEIMNPKDLLHHVTLPNVLLRPENIQINHVINLNSTLLFIKNAPLSPQTNH